MGILNATPDSFYASSRTSPDTLVARAGEMLSDGAAVLDIGGQSTRPGATRLSARDETERVLPVIDELRAHFPDAVLSIDTFHASVAEAAVAHGCIIINDVSAGNMDPEMIPTAAALGVPYILMHMQGTPQDMQDNPTYEDVVTDILDFFIRRIAVCREAGIVDVIADPGFCFGKTLAQNYTLLGHLRDFHVLEVPLAIGVSRKSMIWRLLEITPDQALEGTTALHMLALSQGVHFIRAHDVKPAVQAIRLWEYFRHQI
jgi:dihydropteroate synthase